ncbi:MAG: methyl-accepting chemotaxis protein [Planctomycetaceae bacterium]
MSLRSRIAAVAGLLVLAAIAVSTLVQTLAARRALIEQARAGADGIARMLARAAAFAEDVPALVEDEIGRHMLAEARLLAAYVAAAERAGDSTATITDRLAAVADETVVDQLLVTGTDGAGTIDSARPEKPFVFLADPARQPEAHAFHRLLTGETQSLVQKAQPRDQDGRIYKYAGVAGLDKPRIVEVGMEATFRDRLEKNLGVRRLVAELVGGDVREVQVLDRQLAPIVGRRLDAEGGPIEGGSMLAVDDTALAREAMASGQPVGRLTADGYHVAAPVSRADGRSSGAVLVTLAADSSRDVLWWQAAGAAASALLVGLPGVLAAMWMARSIAEPVNRALTVAESIAAGDLTHRIEAGGGSREIGRLLGSFERMTQSLGGLVGRIQQAGERLSSVEADATSALTRQEQAVRSVNGSANEIAAAVTEISATGEQLLDATSSVTSIAREAAEVAEQGRGGLESMAASMEQLDEAMNAFTRKLATISQRASGITSVVTTIAKVAEQTNLLSVNATIEAEKAGESGRGFRIVAQEIRRLADQTALSTKDIERMVRDMQAAVASGTMEMDRFRNEVSGRIGEVADVSEKLGRIIEPVQSVTRSLETVHQGMESQSLGARQIRDAMGTLRTEAGESAASLAVFATSLAELRRAIVELNAEVARFRTSPDGRTDAVA